MNANGAAVILYDGILDNKKKLTKQAWATLINDVANPYYRVSVTTSSETYPYFDEYPCVRQFREPNRYKNKASFLPSDWGFECRYYFENELNDEALDAEPERKTTTVTRNGLTIETERLRCGYIENSYVVLSPRRENAGRSYLELRFDKAIFSFMYRACLWGASEYLDGEASLSAMDLLGNWTVLQEITVSSLKTKEDGLTQFSFLMTPTIALRFETTATPTGTRNKGRLCLGDLVFCTNVLEATNPYPDYDYAF